MSVSTSKQTEVHTGSEVPKPIAIDLCEQSSVSEPPPAIPRVSTVREYIETFPARFRPEAAKDLTAVYQFSLSDEGTDTYHHFHLDIDKERGCFLRDGKHPSPSVTISADANAFLSVSNSKFGQHLYLLSQMKVITVEGPPELAKRLSNMIKSPSAAPELHSTSLALSDIPTAEEYIATMDCPMKDYEVDGKELLMTDTGDLDTKYPYTFYGNLEPDYAWILGGFIYGAVGHLYSPLKQKWLAIANPGPPEDQTYAFTADTRATALLINTVGSYFPGIPEASASFFHYGVELGGGGFEYTRELCSDDLVTDKVKPVHFMVRFNVEADTVTAVLGLCKSLPYSIFDEVNWSNMDCSGLYCSGFLAGISGVSMSDIKLDMSILVDADFTGVTFTGPITFKSASLTNVKFSTDKQMDDLVSFEAATLNTDFSDYRFNNTVFDSATVDETNFTDAQFVGVSMKEVDLTNANINTPFQGSKDHPTDFTNATLPFSLIEKDWSYKILEGTTITDLGTDLPNVNATGANLSGQSFHEINFKGMTLEDANLSLTSFVDCDLTGATVSSGTVFNGTNFIGSVLTDVNFSGAQLGLTEELQPVTFSRAYLTNVDLTSANLFQVNMSHAQLYGDKTNLANADMQEVDLSNSNVGSASFAGVALSGAVLDAAVLIGCNMTNAILSGTAVTEAPASLVAASLQGADFTGAKLQGVHLTDAAVAMEEGVPLFSIDVASNISDLNAGVLTDHLREEFESKGFILSDDTQIEVTQPDSQWQVVDSSDDVTAGTYSTFNLRKLEDGVNIRVYGKVVIIERLTSTSQGSQLEIIHESILATKITADNFDELTVCPNGIRFGQQAPGTTFEEMMIAATVLPPPSCIPSPTEWCPHPTAMRLFNRYQL